MAKETFDTKLAALINHSDCKLRDCPTNFQEVKKALDLAGNPGGVLRLLTEENSNEVFCVWLMYKDLESFFSERKFEPLIQPWPYEAPPYRISKASGRGMGMFATRTILSGETVLWERPITLKPFAVGLYKKEVEAMGKLMVSKLGKIASDQYLELSNCHSDEPGELTFQIHSTNAFSAQFIQSKYLPDYCGIFPIMSRCNHDCTPNANSSFNSTVFAMELRATRKIYAGEEITLAYVSPLGNTSERQEELESRYKFTCKCTVCRRDKVGRAASDKRRSSIECGLNPDFYARIWKSRDPNYAKRLYSMILSDIEEEELFFYRYTHLRGLTQIYAALGDEKNTIKLAKEAKEACKTAIDGELLFRDYSVWDECIKNVKSHPNWKDWVQ